MHEMMIAKATVIGSAIGKTVILPLTPVLMLGADIINEATAVPLTIVCAVGGGCWWLSGTLRGLKDGQESTHKRLSRIERKLDIEEDEDEENE